LRLSAGVLVAIVLTGCAGPPGVASRIDPVAANVIYFQHDAYKLDDSYRSVLEAHARRMRLHPSLRLRLEATTDAQGPLEYNRALSRKRAETVMRELVALGVPAARIEIAGLGEARHAGRGAGHDGNAADRRVELIYR
jgi:peptidoglycan-associated lipoprotein